MLSCDKILVPVDFGEASEHALEVGLDLVQRFGGSLTLMHVCDVPSYAFGSNEVMPMDFLTPIEQGAKDELDAVLARTKKVLPGVQALMRRGSPWHQILEVIEETRPDLVILGTHGRQGIRRALLGSVAERVVRLSPVSVLTVHAKRA